MKSNNKEKARSNSNFWRKYGQFMLLGLLMLGTGLGLGYVLFSGNSDDSHLHDNHEKNEAAKEGSETWTCSMHPQIRQNEFGICPICEMDLTPLDANVSDDPLVLKMTEESVKLADIQTSIIGEESGTSGKIIHLTGKVKSDERMASSQVAHLPGRIEKLYVTFTGEQVMEGQILADIYSPELITAQRELLEAQKIMDINPDLIEAVRNKLRYWKITESAIRSIEQSGEIQETFPLYAQESGVVSKRRVAVGDHVKQGESLFDLINLSKVWVLFEAYEEDLSKIRLGDRIEFTASTIPNKTFRTSITFIDPMVNPETRTTSLRTEISNVKGLLKPETLVYGTLNQIQKTKGQLTVPKTAVLWTGKKSVVYVKLENTDVPSYQFRQVEIGDEQGDRYLIIEGLEAGEEVVTYGNFAIDAAAQLNNQASMMNQHVQLRKEEGVANPNFQKETPDAFKKQLNEIANHYIEIKDAFVRSDSKGSQGFIHDFLESLKKMDGKVLESEANLFWMESYNAMYAHSKKIAETDDLEKQRVQFGFVSDALIQAIEAFGTKGETLYVQHCPMAFDNEGGDWLAKEEGIQNPYFGDKMMKCGLVKRTVNE